MVGVLAVVLIVALILWLVSASPPVSGRVPPWGSWLALAIVLVCLTLIVLGVGVECEGQNC